MMRLAARMDPQVVAMEPVVMNSSSTVAVIVRITTAKATTLVWERRVAASATRRILPWVEAVPSTVPSTVAGIVSAVTVHLEATAMVATVIVRTAAPSLATAISNSVLVVVTPASRHLLDRKVTLIATTVVTLLEMVLLVLVSVVSRLLALVPVDLAEVTTPVADPARAIVKLEASTPGLLVRPQDHAVEAGVALMALVTGVVEAGLAEAMTTTRTPMLPAPLTAPTTGAEAVAAATSSTAVLTKEALRLTAITKAVVAVTVTTAQVVSVRACMTATDPAHPQTTPLCARDRLALRLAALTQRQRLPLTLCWTPPP